MPNGDPDFHEKELPVLERFFNTIEPSLATFAAQRNLRIDKYYHQVPGWDFRFCHPNGGEAYLELRRVDDQTVQMMCAWWQDDYDKATRSTRWSKSEELKLQEVDLLRILNAKLDEMLAWKPGEWTQIDTGFQEIWHKTWSKDAFDSISSHLPRPSA